MHLGFIVEEMLTLNFIYVCLITLQIVRVGHPARLSDTVQSLSLDALLKSADSAEIISDVRKDIKKAIVSCTRRTYRQLILT